MTSYTTIVNVDAESTATSVARLIANLIGPDGAKFTSECATLIEATQTAELISKYLEHASVIFSQESEKDIESCTQAIVSVLFTLNDEVDTKAIITQIIGAVTASVESSRNRLRALVSLFNLTGDIQSKYAVLSAIFSYAISTDQGALVGHFHVHLENWATSWDLSLSDRRSLYRLVSQVLSTEDQASLSLKYLISFFKTFKDEAFSAEVEALATVAVVNVIKLPVSSFQDRTTLLESMPANLGGELSKLVELLSIVCAGSLTNYKTFATSNASLLTKHAINTETTHHALSLLTICSLGAQQSTIPYSTIATELGVPMDDVEMWVVEAMSYGLLEGSMDQFSGTVSISRCIHRSFGPEHWRGVQQKLTAIRANLATVLDSIKKHGV